MKRILRIALLVTTVFLAVVPTQAAKFSYPSEDKEWFTVDIPASWKPEVGDDESLEATSPDEDAYLAFWVLKNAKEIDHLDKDIEELVADSVKDLKLNDKPTEKKVNGIDFMMFAGTGKEKEDGSDVGVEIFLFSPKPGKVGVFFCQYSAKAPDAIKGLVKIVESIQLTAK
jgi:hypothetical protein